MLRYPFDTVDINPHRRTVVQLLDLAARTANIGCLVRQVSSDTLVSLWAYVNRGRFRRSPGRWQWTHGGGILSPPGYDAGTSVLGSAWYWAPDGSLHVRVVGGRVRVAGEGRRLSVPDPFGYPGLSLAATNSLLLVYPQLQVQCDDLGADSVPAELARRLLVRPTDRICWSVLSDWREDHGEDARVREAKDALTVLDVLERHGVRT